MGPIVKDRVEALLQDRKGRTHSEIAKAIGVCEDSSRRAVWKLKAENKVRISDWRPNPGHADIPIFSLGSEPDKPKRKPMDNSTRLKIYRNKLSERQRNDRLDAERIRPVARDPLVSAMFGYRAPINPTPLVVRVHQHPMDVADEVEAA